MSSSQRNQLEERRNMKTFRMLVVVLLAVLLMAYVGALASSYATSDRERQDVFGAVGGEIASIEGKFAENNPTPSALANYRLEASRSKFIAEGLAGGLLWFKGHNHLIAVREFTGEARLDPDSINASSLEIVAKSASMEETSSVFTEPQKQIINKELREIVLLPDRYPEITFKSTNVTGKSTGANQYDLKIDGNLTLLGLTRPVTIPTKVTVTGNELRAQGEFSIDRSDYKVKATSAVHGMVRVRHTVKFEFDIVGSRL
jgi:polyisoprenoid-binding protein YceI